MKSPFSIWKKQNKNHMSRLAKEYTREILSVERYLEDCRRMGETATFNSSPTTEKDLDTLFESALKEEAKAIEIIARQPRDIPDDELIKEMFRRGLLKTESMTILDK